MGIYTMECVYLKYIHISDCLYIIDIKKMNMLATQIFSYTGKTCPVTRQSPMKFKRVTCNLTWISQGIRKRLVSGL